MNYLSMNDYILYNIYEKMMKKSIELKNENETMNENERENENEIKRNEIYKNEMNIKKSRNEI